LRHTFTAVELRFSCGTPSCAHSADSCFLHRCIRRSSQPSGILQLAAETDTCTPTQASLVATPSTDLMDQSNATGSEGRDSSSRRTKAALLALVHCEVPTHRRDSSCPRNVTGRQGDCVGRHHIPFCALLSAQVERRQQPTADGWRSAALDDDSCSKLERQIELNQVRLCADSMAFAHLPTVRLVERIAHVVHPS
jgi:hypothetical protein